MRHFLIGSAPVLSAALLMASLSRPIVGAQLPPAPPLPPPPPPRLALDLAIRSATITGTSPGVWASSGTNLVTFIRGGRTFGGEPCSASARNCMSYTANLTVTVASSGITSIQPVTLNVLVAPLFFSRPKATGVRTAGPLALNTALVNDPNPMPPASSRSYTLSVPITVHPAAWPLEGSADITGVDRTSCAPRPGLTTCCNSGPYCFYIVVVADRPGLLREGNEINNTFEIEMNLEPGRSTLRGHGTP